MIDEYDPTLKSFRDKIDSLDEKIVELLVAREKIIRDVSEIKFDQDIPAVLEKRVQDVKDKVIKHAKKNGTDGSYVEEIYTHIIKTSCDLESQIFSQKEEREKKIS